MQASGTDPAFFPGFRLYMYTLPPGLPEVCSAPAKTKNPIAQPFNRSAMGFQSFESGLRAGNHAKAPVLPAFDFSGSVQGLLLPVQRKGFLRDAQMGFLPHQQRIIRFRVACGEAESNRDVQPLQKLPCDHI